MNIVAGTLAGIGPGAGWRMGASEAAANHCVAHTLRAEGFDASEDGTGRGTPLVPVPFDTTQITSAANRSNPKPGDPCHPLAAGAHPPAVAIGCFKGGQGSSAGSIGYDEHVAPTLGAADSGSNRTPALMQGMAVRRLTPRECERLQGFPDGYTAILWRGKTAADGPRYKALGNSWAVNCARWVGRRIESVDSLKPSNRM